MMEGHLKESFPPITNKDVRVLILGTMPGDESLRRQEYYAHPRNRFWKLIAAIFNETLPAGYDDRKKMLLRYHIAVWDVAEEVERDGSLDSAIRNEAPHDLDGFLNDHKKIKLICFNGQKAAALFDRYFRHRQELRYEILPSTSPANSAIGWAGLLKNWSIINT